MPEIPLDSVHIDVARIRQDVGNIDELAQSFQELGQIHAILLDEDNTILAGLRRFLAARKLGWQTIRADYFSGLDEITKKRIELEENILRLQLTWQEEVLAKRGIHQLMQGIHGKSAPGEHNPEGAWKVEDTARLLRQSKGMTSMDLTLADAIEYLPGIERSEGKRAALRIYRKLKETAILSELAKRRESGSEGKLFHFFHADCCERLPEMPSDFADLIITDPPYGIGYDSVRRDRETAYKGIEFHDDLPYVLELFNDAAHELYRVLKPGGHCYVFASPSTWTRFEPILVAQRFLVRSHPLIWVKNVPTPGQVASGGFMNRYEIIIFAWKDVPRPLKETTRGQGGQSADDVFGADRQYPAPTQRLHSTEKPVELLRYMIRLSSEEGETVLDPFAGSGSTAVAATLEKRRSISFEIEAEAYGAAIARLEGGLM